MNTDHLVTDIVARFDVAGSPAVSLEWMLSQVAEAGIGDPWSFSHLTLSNALRPHGLVIRDGMIEREPEPVEHYEPAMSDYTEFKAAAKQIVEEAEYPVDAMDLASAVGLARSAIPYATMRYHLQRVGVHHIPGLGYWRAKEYTDPSGRVISTVQRSERAHIVLEAFEKQGWPVAARDIEQQSEGRVTSRYVSMYAVQAGKALIKGIGRGLFVPMDKADDKPMPMSRNVALAVLTLTPEVMIDDADHLRMFQIATILEHLGLATIKRSRSSKAGRRTQTMRVTLTDAGRRAVEKIAKQASDEF